MCEVTTCVERKRNIYQMFITRILWTHNSRWLHSLLVSMLHRYAVLIIFNSYIVFYPQTSSKWFTCYYLWHTCTYQHHLNEAYNPDTRRHVSKHGKKYWLDNWVVSIWHVQPPTNSGLYVQNQNALAKKFSKTVFPYSTINAFAAQQSK